MKTKNFRISRTMFRGVLEVDRRKSRGMQKKLPEEVIRFMTIWSFNCNIYGERAWHWLYSLGDHVLQLEAPISIWLH
jgi:hypothetical protein